MAYQPLYATISDTNATRSTTSVRSRVEWISFWLNSHFGSVMKVSADSEGSLNKPCTYEAEQKIKEWADKGSTKRVNIWKKKLKEREIKNKELEAQEQVLINIDLEDNPKYKFCLNGISFKAEDLKLLAEYKKKDFLGTLSVASAFALIPDIKKVVDNPKDEEAVKTLISKRDNITKFIKEEENKIKV